MKKTWMLVADGHRAKFLVKEGKTLRPIEPTHHQDELTLVKTKDRGHHKPGRARSRNPMATENFFPGTDWRKFEREAFAKDVAHLINSASDKFDKLIVAAPPETLGQLRQHFDSAVKEKIRYEIKKDLTKRPLKDVINYIWW